MVCRIGEGVRVHQMGLTEGGGPGAAKELWEAGDLTGSARPRPAPWLKPSATANSCEGEGGSLEIFLPRIFCPLSQIRDNKHQGHAPTKYFFQAETMGSIWQPHASRRSMPPNLLQAMPGDAAKWPRPPSIPPEVI